MQAKRRPLACHEDILLFQSGNLWYNPQMDEGEEYTISPKAGGLMAGGKTCSKTIFEGKRQSGRFPRSVKKIANASLSVGLHPTQKPVALMEYLIRTYTNPGDTILDNTMGSGTTGVACMNTGRNFIGMEKDVEHGYFQIAEKRIKLAWELNSL